MAKANNLRQRIDYWKRQEGCSSDTVLARNLTYDQATRREAEERGRCGSHCRGEAGGPRDNARDWCVYRLDGCR